LAHALNASGTAVVTDLMRLHRDCPPNVWKYLGESPDNIVTQVTGYISEVQGLSRSVEDVPSRVAMLQDQLASVGTVVNLCLALPWSLVLACFVAICLTLLVVEHSGGKCARRCEQFEMPCLGLGCVAPAVLLVSAVASAELLLGILVSGFCLAPDSTAMSYAGDAFGVNSSAFNMTRYYLTGNGSNAALLHLGLAQTEINSAIAWVRRYGDVIAKTCPQWGAEGAAILNLQNVQYSMNETQSLLSPSNIYAYYQATVHETVCGTLPPYLVGSATLQMLLSFLCLPALLCIASCTIDGLVDERSMNHGFHDFDLLAQDDRLDVDSPLD